MDKQTKQYLEMKLKREQDHIECEEKHEEKMLNQMMQMTAPQMYRSGDDNAPNYYSNMPYPSANQSVPRFNEEASLNVCISRP